MRTIFDTFGVTWPNYSDWVSAGAALLILTLLWLAAAAFGRWVGPKLAGFWTRHGGTRGEDLAERTGPIVRYAVFLVAAGIALNADAWRPLALIVFGIAIAVGAALLVLTLARGLQLARWMAWLLAGFAFVGLLGRSVGSLRPLTRPFDRIGFSAGKVHITLLTLVQAVIVLLALYAAVKLLNRIAAHVTSPKTMPRGPERTTEIMQLSSSFAVGGQRWTGVHQRSRRRGTHSGARDHGVSHGLGTARRGRAPIGSRAGLRARSREPGSRRPLQGSRQEGRPPSLLSQQAVPRVQNRSGPVHLVKLRGATEVYRGSRL